MGFGVVFSSIFVVWLILISFLVSPVHSSRSCISSGLQSHETTIAAAKRAGSIAQGHQIVRQAQRKGDADASNFGSRRKLLREAPFGSDSPQHDTKPDKTDDFSPSPALPPSGSLPLSPEWGRMHASSSFVADKESKRQRKQAPWGSDPVHHDNTTARR